MNEVVNATKRLERRGDPDSAANQKLRRDATVVVYAIFWGFARAFNIDQDFWEDDLTWNLPRGYKLRCVRYPHKGLFLNELICHGKGGEALRFVATSRARNFDMMREPWKRMELAFAEQLARDIGTRWIGELRDWFRVQRGDSGENQFMTQIVPVVNNPSRTGITGTF